MAPAFTRSLRFTLLASMAALWVGLFSLVGFSSYTYIQSRLKLSVSGQSIALATHLAGRLQPLVPKSALVSPEQKLEPALAAALDEAVKDQLAEDVVLINGDGVVLADSTGEALPGSKVHGWSAEMPALLKSAGSVALEPVQGSFGVWHQSVFIPLRGGTLMELRVNPTYLRTLREFSNFSILAGSLGLLVSLVVGLVLAGRILRPVTWLEQAAHRAAQGHAAEALPDGDGELDQAARNVAGSLEQLLSQQIQAKLRKEHAEQRYDEARQMAAGIAHEVRNPLGVLQGQLDLLGRHLGEGHAGLQQLQRSRQQLHELDSIVTRFLELSRVPRLETKPLELGPLLEALRYDLEQTPAAQGHPILVIAEAGLIVQGDEALLKGALLNLGQNSLQAMGPTGQLSLSASRQGAEARVSIVDQGPGFSPDALGRLFQPFFTTKPQGSGLGLALARRTVAAHGGDLSAANAAHGGAEVTLTLPLATPTLTRES